MKKMLALLLVLLMVFSLAACGGSSKEAEPEEAAEAPAEAPADEAEAPADDAEAPADDGEPKRIGLTMNSFDSYQTIWYESFVEEAEKFGYEVTVTNADTNVDNQIKDIENFITNDMDLIVVCAVEPDGIAAAVDEANAAGIPVVAGQHELNANYEARVMMMTDQAANGVAQCQAIADWLEKNPGKELKCGYLQGVAAQWAAAARFQGFCDNLPEGAELVVTNTANWNADEATALVEDWLVAYPELNCIAAANDDMAVAAMNVLKSQGKTDFSDFLILGLNAQEDAVQYIKEGTFYCSVYYGQDMEARNVADVAHAVLNGVDFGGANIYGDGVEGALLPVTAENVDTFKDEYAPVLYTVDELLNWNK